MSSFQGIAYPAVLLNVEERGMEIHDVLGGLGVLLIVGTYLLLQTGRVSAKELRYSLLNAAGAALVLVSLSFEFNMSAALVEGFWLLISLYGIARALRRS